MLLVRTSLRPSHINGLGCFAEEPIKEGQVIWVFNPHMDVRLPVEDVAKFPQAIRELWEVYAYEEIHDGVRTATLSCDFSRHMNHSGNPNIHKGTTATRDIEIGEELTCDYYTFALDADRLLANKNQLIKI
jgi:hypothetical protein